MAIKNLLLVDDEKSIHDIFNKYLDNKSYRLISAFDGNEALKKFSQEELDIVLLDILKGNQTKPIISIKTHVYHFES